MTLYHWTCDHGFVGITRSGCQVKPVRQAAMPGQPRLSWFTDVEHMSLQHIHGLGLQSEMLRCERWIHRFKVVDETGIIPWKTWLAANPLPLEWVSMFTMGRMPKHWFVADTPTKVMIG